MNKIFLKVEGSTGKLFETIKEEKAGYEKYTSSTGKVSYRKHFKDVTGELLNTEIRDTDWGQLFGIALKNEDTIFKIELNIYSQDKNVENRYMESMLKLLPLINKGETYTISPYNFIPEGEKYPKAGMSVKKGTEKLKASLTNSYYDKKGNLVPGDIPAIKWVEKLGKKKPSAVSLEQKDEFLLDLLTTHNERLKWAQTAETSPRCDKPAEEVVRQEIPKKAATIAATIEDDDLPF
jgi:hypothetical protein